MAAEGVQIGDSLTRSQFSGRNGELMSVCTSLETEGRESSRVFSGAGNRMFLPRVREEIGGEKGERSEFMFEAQYVAQ